MSDENEKLETKIDEDFEGHRIDEQLAEQRLDRTDDVAEPDFEGHRFDTKFDAKFDTKFDS